MSPSDISATNLQWLAGILEGEGYFGMRVSSQQGRSDMPRITLHMTDLDIVQKAALLLGSKVRSYKQDNPKYKEMHETNVFGHRALAWMRVLEPHMGQRRKERIRAILTKGYNPVSPSEKVARAVRVRKAHHYSQLNELNGSLFEQRTEV